MNVMESEECYVDDSPQIDHEYMLDFSKIKNNDIRYLRACLKTKTPNLMDVSYLLFTCFFTLFCKINCRYT